MQLFRNDLSINFMRWRWLAVVLSSLLVVLSLVLLLTRGLNWGLDFTGGTVLELSFAQAANLDLLRQQLTQAGYAEAVVQFFGSTHDVLVRLPSEAGAVQQQVGEQVFRALQAQSEVAMTLSRVEFVGPSVGEELKQDGGLAVLVALLGILVYVGFRFEWRLSLGAVLSLAHDVILTLGLFSLLQLEFDLTVLAAILALIGYSINDTIVVFDRVREMFRKLRDETVLETINQAITSTLNRTVITSLTTMLVLVVLFFKGGALIHGFATALLFGIAVGTYSSVYVASGVAVLLGLSREDLLAPKPVSEQEELQP
ncbi:MULTISPECIES: protein translocase subunit SecF [unclassified Alishewanella]|jgi:preprotein translocase subunit SecF|uniref:protein translocase subunit SecF n=1 Tax=unclassified Alishewanella TaxID=2628974 RepID=UPI000823600A|nr:MULTISPECIES: protein translocase subunit SecF [unclassified Alishewanella]MCT8126280.1 protein translocase subunit SecF [Alishewanella sp. BS5-314]OCW97479.1 protein-export membrane protein SecF [Alishewanella sp. HH-ZS]